MYTKALLYAPYTDVRGLLAIDHIIHVDEFVVVEPFTYLPKHLLDPSKLKQLATRWTDKFTTEDVGLAQMLDTYYMLGFTLDEATTNLQEQPLYLMHNLSQTPLKLYHHVDLPTTLPSLQQDVKRCNILVNTTSHHLPATALDQLGDSFIFVGYPEEITYVRQMDDTVLGAGYDAFNQRIDEVYKIVDSLPCPDIAFMFDGPYKNPQQNLVLQQILYKPYMVQVSDLEDLDESM